MKNKSDCLFWLGLRFHDCCRPEPELEQTDQRSLIGNSSFLDSIAMWWSDKSNDSELHGSGFVIC